MAVSLSLGSYSPYSGPLAWAQSFLNRNLKYGRLLCVWFLSGVLV